MQTRSMIVTAQIDRPETLAPCSFSLLPGARLGFVTYRINGIPADVPVFEVIRFAQAGLDCAASPVGHYIVDWATLVVADRR